MFKTSDLVAALAELNAATTENDEAQRLESRARRRAGDAAHRLQAAQQRYDTILKMTRRIAADPVDGPKALAS